MNHQLLGYPKVWWWHTKSMEDFSQQCGKVWELTLPIQTLPLPVGGDSPAISCPSTEDSHPFCAVPAPTELLPWYNTDDKGRDLGEAEGLRLLQVSILPATEAESTSSVSFPRASLPPSAGTACPCWCPGTGGVHLPHWPEVSSPCASFSSGSPTFLFSQPGLAGFLKGLHSQAWDLKLGLMSLMSLCSSLAEKPVCLRSIFNSDSPCSRD